MEDKRVGYDALTLEDCEYLHDKVGLSMKIEDGHVARFEYEETDD